MGSYALGLVESKGLVLVAVHPSVSHSLSTSSLMGFAELQGEGVDYIPLHPI